MTTKDAGAVLDERAAEYLKPSSRGPCQLGKPGYLQEVRLDSCGHLLPGRGGCVEPAHHLAIGGPCHPDALTLDGTVIRKPTVYSGVLGSKDLKQLTRAWVASRSWWAYPDGKRGESCPDCIPGFFCNDIAPDGSR